jgi:1-phosphofructokinase
MIITVTPNPVLDHTLTVPEIAFDTVTRATAIRDDWGGKGFNVSRVLLALGVESTALGFIGGATGQRLAAGLASLGLPTDFVTIAGETRTNVVITDAQARRYIKVNEAGPTVQPEEIAQFMDKVRQRAVGGEKHAAGDTWTLCGSLPPGVPDNFYAQIIRVLQPLGVRVLLDTSGAALSLGVEARPFLVKPNTDEAAAFVGHPVATRDDALHAARAFLERGIAQVALSLGADGLLLATRDVTVFATPPAVPVKNVTGAGDALLAGLAYALERGLPLAEQARWGVAAGTASAMHEGVGVVTRESVEQVYAETTVEVMRDA